MTMVTNTLAWKVWEAWEAQYQRSNRADYARNLEIFEALYDEAVALGVLPRRDRLEGLEQKIRLAEALHVSTTAHRAGAGA
jgi:hypothetical protein